MTFAALVVAALFVCSVQVVCGDWIPDRICATLFSEAEYGGVTFSLKDFDQSVNLLKEYRHSLNGWQNTGSIRVQDDCKLTACSDTYFLGSCFSLSKGNSSLNQITAGIQSVNCTCNRKCNCGDLFTNKWASEGRPGRIYLNGGCNICDTEYLPIEHGANNNFPEWEKDSVEAIVIRSGCNITTYSEPDQKGQETFITGPVYQRFKGTVGSYGTISCDDKKFVPANKPSVNTTYVPKIHLPASKDTLYQIMRSKNDTLSNHPGLQAALLSAQNGRSSRNAYVILIGRYPFWFGFRYCQHGHNDRISECRISLELDELGTSAQLRVITVNIGSDRSIEKDYVLMATLDEFMGSHEELNSSIPNAVIICHQITDKTLKEKGHSFQRKLQALQALRYRLVDENYSNVIFILEHLENLELSVSRQPKAKIEEFVNAAEMWPLPNPLIFCIASNTKAIYSGRYVNGYFKLANQEYWPKNLEVNLENICEKGGDPLGRAIFRASFQHTQKHFSIPLLTHNISPAEIKVKQYRDMSTFSPSEKFMRTSFQIQLWNLKNEMRRQNEEFKVQLALEEKARLEDVKRIEADIWKKLNEDLRRLFE